MRNATTTCDCGQRHQTRRVVLTGGPGAGKTAVLELVHASACRHVVVLPEAAGIVFGGGFPRRQEFEGRRAAQRAIFHVQHELEAVAEIEDAAILLCDRGTLDGLAYWPGDPDDLWAAVHSDLRAELDRYSAVIHLQTPTAEEGYNRDNPIRTESAATAALVDARIAEIWSAHPRVTTIPPDHDFMVKANAALSVIRSLLPDCCRSHAAPVGQQLWSGDQPA